MTKGEAICQEFSDEVLVLLEHVYKGGKWSTERTEEIKCRLNIEHFTGLVERMVQAGYCCTQVQRDFEQFKCTAWFEPMSLEEIV